MAEGNYFYDEKEDDDDDDDDDSPPDLYSILNLHRNANQEEIHRSYRSLSTSFHPDKIRRRPLASQGGNAPDMEEIQETFLQFKKAHDVLIDPVLRLAYDHYGDYGVELVRRMQQQQRDQKTRRDRRNESNDNQDEEGDEEDDDDDEDGALNLYERLENLLVVQKNLSKARSVLDSFMEQHDYQQNLTEDNYVHLNLSMTLPPAVPLKPVLFKGRDYLRYVQKSIYANPPKDAEEKEYFRQRMLQEGRLVDYQISQLRSSQKADLGFTLSSVQPPRNSRKAQGKNNEKQRQMKPSKWSMAIGCNTDLIYPGVAEIANMAQAIKNKQKQEEYQEMAQKHPVSAFVNTSYTPNPQTQLFWTANVNNDNESHQYSFGSTHTFTNQTACRYGMTYLTRSPLPDEAPLIFNLKSYRHLQNIGTASVGVSASSGGQMLQWNAKWEGTKTSKIYRFVHKGSVKASLGMLQGNSIDLGYKCKLPKSHDDETRSTKQNNRIKEWYEWLEGVISLPKDIEITTVLGRFQKVSAMVTHELTSLATHPTLGFGMEHDVTLGRWAWIWEIQYNQSTFRIPISVLQLGTVADSRSFYAQKFYYGIYCLLMQSMVADLLKDHDSDDESGDGYRNSKVSEPEIQEKSVASEGWVVKTKAQAEKQLSLMKPVAEKKRYREQKLQQLRGNAGLIILGATYSQKFSLKSEESNRNSNGEWLHEIVSMDATPQLQFWVNRSKLAIPSQLPKSSWMGFYSLHTESKLFLQHQKNLQNAFTNRRWWSYGREKILNLKNAWSNKQNNGGQRDSWHSKFAMHDPQLTIRYVYGGSVFEISVGDTESLQLPCFDGSAEKLGDADYVQ